MTAHIEDVVLSPEEPFRPSRRTAAEALDKRRPTLSGDLREMLPHAPVFRRNVAGYDRFQVDTYVHWAEDELAGAARIREEMLTRLVQLRTELDEARRQLTQSAGVREALRLVPRIGWVLAAAADQADEMRADADADRATASAEAQRLVTEASAEAERILADARAEAQLVLTEARVEAERLGAASAALVADSERTAAAARAEVCRVSEEIGALRRRAAEEAERTRRTADQEAVHARAQARDDVLRLLTAGREQRHRIDAEASAARAALESAATQRVDALRAEVEELEGRLALVGAVAGPSAADQVIPGPRAARHARAGTRRPVGLLHLGRRRHT